MDSDQESDAESHGSVDELILNDLEESIQHDVIPVPPKACPFPSTSVAIFFAALDEISGAVSSSRGIWSQAGGMGGQFLSFVRDDYIWRRWEEEAESDSSS